jgi:hypothetical protein
MRKSDGKPRSASIALAVVCVQPTHVFHIKNDVLRLKTAPVEAWSIFLGRSMLRDRCYGAMAQRSGLR